MPPDSVGLVALVVGGLLLIGVVLRRCLRRRKQVTDIRSLVDKVKRKRTGERQE